MRPCIVDKKAGINRAQSVAEYSVCLALVLAALLGMQLYVKRGLEGRYKQVVDHATKQAYTPKQYEPYYAQDEFTVLQSKRVNEIIEENGWVGKNYLEDKAAVQGTSIRDIK